MKYCSNCAAPVEFKVPEHDDRERYCCPSCNHIHYVNPKVIVGCIPIWEDKILMCKRGIEPRKGYWTLPGGFMEMDETTEQGALRETWEETRARAEIVKLHGVYNIPQISQIYFFYLANLLAPDYETTFESIEIRLCEKKDIPWDQLAFKVVDLALKQYVDDKDNIQLPYHHSEIRL